jgi:hypothetical protein
MEDEVKNAIEAEQDPVQAVLNSFATEEERQLAAKVGAKLLPVLVAKAQTAAEAKLADRLRQEVNALAEENSKLITAKLEEYRKQLTPPTPDDIQKVLSQEYVEFKVQVGNNGSRKEFVIRELPLVAEQRLVKTLSKTLGERVQDFSRLNWQQAMDGDMLTRIMHIAQVVPGTMETLAECCAVCLDPFGDVPEITPQWVEKNIGLSRVLAILDAQMKAGRYRDFFSLVSRYIPQTMTA